MKGSLADIAWAAGLFEGEGHVGVRSETGRLSGVMLLTMTDRDVVLHFRDVVDCGLVHKEKRDLSSGNKQPWSWRLSETEKIVEIGRYFHPWLGARRRQQFEDIIASYRDAIKARMCAECGAVFNPRYGRMSRRQRFCGPLCRGRFHARLVRARKRALA